MTAGYETLTTDFGTGYEMMDSINSLMFAETNLTVLAAADSGSQRLFAS